MDKLQIESAFNNFQYLHAPISDIDVDSVCDDLRRSNKTSNSKFRTSMIDQNWRCISNKEILVYNNVL